MQTGQSYSWCRLAARECGCEHACDFEENDHIALETSATAGCCRSRAVLCPHADGLAARLVLTSSTACTLQSCEHTSSPTPVPVDENLPRLKQSIFVPPSTGWVTVMETLAGTCRRSTSWELDPRSMSKRAPSARPQPGCLAQLEVGPGSTKQRAGVCTERPPGPWWARQARGASRWPASAAARPTPSPPPRSRLPARVPAAAAHPAAPLRGAPARLLRRVACVAHRAFRWHDSLSSIPSSSAVLMQHVMPSSGLMHNNTLESRAGMPTWSSRI